MRLNVQPKSRVELEAANRVKIETLGAEFLGWESFNWFESRHEQIQFGHTRWPGGIPVEDGIDIDGTPGREHVFDLRNDNLIDWRRWADESDKIDYSPSGNQREGIREILDFAVANNQSLAIVLPTARYVKAAIDEGDLDRALNAARADVAYFMDRLLGGEFGNLPHTLVLEVGSEYYATDVWADYNAISTDNRDGTSRTTDHDLPSLFGEVFAVIAQEIRDSINMSEGESLRPSETNIKTAVQLPRFQSAPDETNIDGQVSDGQAFLNAFEKHDSLDAIDAVIWHRYVPSFEQIEYGLWKPLHDATLEDQVAAWSAAAGRDLEVVGGWLAPGVSSANAEQNTEHGAASLTAIMHMFAGLVQADMDIGSIYALGFGRNGSLAYREELFLGGQLFKLMVESLPGKALHETFIDNMALRSPDEPDRIGSAINEYIFEDEDEIVVFLFSGSRDSAGAPVELLISDTFREAEITRLIPPSSAVDAPSSEIGFVGELRSESLKEIERSGDQSIIEVNFSAPFEVVRVTLRKDVAPPTNNIIFGTPVGDSVMGTSEEDTVFLEAGFDWAYTLDGNDTVYGGYGKDRIFGGTGNDSLFGGHWDDTIFGGEGADEIFGGAGKDSLYGGAGHDRIWGGAWNDAIFGGDGSDRLYGGGGNDRVWGGGESDSIFGGSGNDALYGEDGNDWLYGGDNSDEVWGGGGSDTLLGGTGEDSIFGGDGDDFIRGGDGDDSLFGGDGDDSLHGNSGNDIIFSGDGNDTMFGGDGEDTFVFSSGFGGNRIVDFDVQLDTLGFDAAMYTDFLSSESAITEIYDGGNFGISMTFGRQSIELLGISRADVAEISVLEVQ